MARARDEESAVATTDGSLAAGRRFEDGAVALVVFLGEALIMALAVRLHVAPVWLLLAHAGIVAALGVWLQRRIARGGTAAAERGNGDLTVPLLLVLATFATGPLGALGVLVLLPFANRPAEDSELLAAWYERIAGPTRVDPAERLAKTVAAGRTIDPTRPAPPSFETLMLRGSLAERQAALGLIARKFHPVYAPALRAALKSPEPVVRVQAAAVAARLRGEQKRRLGEALAAIPAALGDAAAVRKLGGELDGLVSAGLLDEGDSARAQLAAAELRAWRPAGSAGSAGSVLRPARGLAGDMPDRASEADLIAAGRFAELRALRHQRRLARHGAFRLRTARARKLEGRA